MILQPNNGFNEIAFRQELGLNAMKSELFSSILNSYLLYQLENHSNPSGDLSLDQIENLVEQSFNVYEISFKRLMGQE